MLQPVLYCCDIAAAKNNSAVLHGVTMKVLCVAYTVTVKDIISFERTGERSVSKFKNIKSSFQAISRNDTESFEDGNVVAKEDKADCGNAFLKYNFLLTRPSIHKMFTELCRVQRVAATQ